MPQKQSPLKQSPLRVPGQSADEAIERLTADEQAKHITIAVGIFTLAVTEWYRYLTKAPYAPILMSLVAAIVIGYSLLKIRTIRGQIRDYRLGRDGERSVAEILDNLKSGGCGVLHDLVGDGFNVDHIVVSSRGIFAIETKTPRKAKGDCIRVEGRRLLVGTASWGERPIQQAIALGEWLGDLLRTSTGKDMPIRAVLVFPDWSVEPIASDLKRKLWVLNPKQLPSWLDNEPHRLSETDVHLATFHLSRYMRVKASKSA